MDAPMDGCEDGCLRERMDGCVACADNVLSSLCWRGGVGYLPVSVIRCGTAPPRACTVYGAPWSSLPQGSPTRHLACPSREGLPYAFSVCPRCGAC